MRNMAAIVNLMATMPDMNRSQALQCMYVLNEIGFVVMPEQEYKELENAADNWWNRPKEPDLNSEFTR